MSSSSKGGHEQNDRNDRGGRDERGDRNDRYERSDRNDRNDRGGYERRDRNDYQSGSYPSGGNRYGDRERESSGIFFCNFLGYGQDPKRASNENIDPRPRHTFIDSARDNTKSYTVEKRKSRSNSRDKNETKRKDR